MPKETVDDFTTYLLNLYEQGFDDIEIAFMLYSRAAAILFCHTNDIEIIVSYLSGSSAMKEIVSKYESKLRPTHTTTYLPYASKKLNSTMNRI